MLKYDLNYTLGSMNFICLFIDSTSATGSKDSSGYEKIASLRSPRTSAHSVAFCGILWHAVSFCVIHTPKNSSIKSSKTIPTFASAEFGLTHCKALGQDIRGGQSLDASATRAQVMFAPSHHINLIQSASYIVNHCHTSQQGLAQNSSLFTKAKRAG